MNISLLIDQLDKFDGQSNKKINLYSIFSNEKEIPNVSKRQFQIKDKLYEWWDIGTLRKEDLEKLSFLDLSICERYEMIPIENKEQIEQVKQLL